MPDRVIWAQNLEHAGSADSVGDAILKAVNAHPDAMMDLRVDAASDTIRCVAVVGDADEPDETIFWEVWLFDEPKSVGDKI